MTVIQEKPLRRPPGSTFRFSGGNTMVLGVFIKRATASDLAPFSKSHLFDRLRIKDAAWLA
ncbi:hypothetical protein [Acanthopleuribacter pedis]|uniref:Uncharacterized protein n=1 Tax=Acanthopleuribacter pedis TaxID=442870 RepID=A0A8J7QJQ8_9BACT|nr:hypothetical protein [Acanthopleuribacter pedis]MBO1319465.1 hypothetical protein [Acanthopleuribacter pedis]